MSHEVPDVSLQLFQRLGGWFAGNILDEFPEEADIGQDRSVFGFWNLFDDHFYLVLPQRAIVERRIGHGTITC